MNTTTEVVTALMDLSLNWKVQIPEREIADLPKIIDNIGEYNEFKPDAVKQALSKIQELLKDKGLRITVARENSPTIYLDFYTLKDGDEKLADQVIDILQETGPNELWQEDTTTMVATVRAFWD